MRNLSIWEKESFFGNQDVIIVGSGFTGLWSALQLKLSDPQKKITVLERGIIPTGASTRNAGFSCFGSPSELIADTAEMGEAAMWELVEKRFKGLQLIRDFFRDDAIDYEPSGGYECFADNEVWTECRENLGWLNKGLERITGVREVFRIADEKLVEFGFAGFAHLVENPLEAGLHPGKLVQGLLTKVRALGVQVLTAFEVVSYEEKDIEVHVFTNQNIPLVTKQLLLCTNAFTGNLFPSIDIVPNRGQVLLTSSIKDLSFKGTFHFDQGFYYFRNLGGRILLGGARNVAFDDEHTMMMNTSDIIQNRLEQFIREHLLPGIPFEITDRWSGIMAMGSHKSPIVQALTDRVFCCVRMSGMGVALAPLLAKEITTLMNERFKA
jgi:glycine/D-amino acid oxidase-like deaminating enzyme